MAKNTTRQMGPATQPSQAIELGRPRTPAPTIAQNIWTTAVHIVPAAGGSRRMCVGGGGGVGSEALSGGPRAGGAPCMHACMAPGPLQGKQLAGQSPRHPPALHLPSRLALGRRMPGSERGQTPHQPCKHLSACITCLSVRHDVLLPRVSRHGCCPQVKRHHLPTPRHHGCAAIRRSMPEQERWVWRLISKGQTLRG